MFTVIHLFLPASIISIVFFRFYKFSSKYHFRLMKLSGQSILFNVLVNCAPEPVSIFRYENTVEKWIDRVVFVVLLLQYFLGNKVLSMVGLRLSKVKSYNRVVLSHRAMGYGLLIFIIIKEGLILDKAELIEAKSAGIIRTSSYIFFLMLYFVLFVIKWKSSNGLMAILIGGFEKQDEGWLQRIYIKDEKEICDLEEQEERRIQSYLRQKQFKKLQSSRMIELSQGELGETGVKKVKTLPIPDIPKSRRQIRTENKQKNHGSNVDAYR